MKKIILAITGASGSLYAVEFLKIAAQNDSEIHCIISEAGEKVLKIELGLSIEQLEGIAAWHAVNDFTAPMASGSSRFDAMIVLPCTMGTLASIAHGLSTNLIHRAADVMLKEKRPLLLSPRETPLNRTHIKNMLQAHDAGAMICPAMPSFYHRPDSITQMARSFAARVADLLGMETTGMKRWQGDPDREEVC